MVEAEEPLELCTACTTSMAKRKGDIFSRVDEIMKKYRVEMDKEAEEEKVEQEQAEKEQEQDDKEEKRLIDELEDARLRIVELEKEDDDEEEEKEGEAASTPETHIKYSPQSPEFL